MKKEHTTEIFFDPVAEQFTRPAHPRVFDEEPEPMPRTHTKTDDWYLTNEAYLERQRELNERE
jgi:hypothetical protein